MREANRMVFERADDDERYAGMGTTLTAALAGPESIHLAHVGDSRAYLLRAGRTAAAHARPHAGRTDGAGG